MSLSFEFAGKVRARLIRLEQQLVYAGLLEGMPTRERNDQLLEGLAQPGTHILVPEQTPLSYQGTYPFGEPAALPRVQCAARLQGQGFTDPVLYESTGTLIWFQEDWAMPIAPGILEETQGLEWSSFAREWEM